MRFLNKSTLFLASVVMLLALGFVFIAAPAMAHDASTIGNLRPHSHPTLLLPAVDNDLDGTAGNDPGEAEVSQHGSHPKVVSITLKAIEDDPATTDVNEQRTSADHVVVSADNDGSSTTPATGVGANQFELIVDFDVPIGTTSQDPLATTDLTNVLLNAVGNPIAGQVEITSSTVDSTDASKFTLKITIDGDSNTSTPTTDDVFPTGTGDLKQFTLRIRVNSDGVTAADETIGTTTIDGSSNDVPSDIYEFVLVHALPEADAPTLAITYAPADGTAVGADGMVTFTFTFTDASGIATEGDGAFTADDITVTGGTKGDFAMTSNLVYTLKVTPDTMYTNVTVSVAAGSVTDAAGVPNDVAATSKTYTAPVADPDGVITIPAESYVIVVRDKDALGNQGLAFPPDLDGNSVNVQEWAAMPDLWNRLFDRNAPGGGGALIVTEYGSTQVRHGSVGVSEIMWGADQGYLGKDREDASQWIELHNLNNSEVKVMLSTKTGTAITDDAKLTGNLTSKATETDVLDVVTNFFNNRPGDPAWDVLGSSGNSVEGGDFASMARILPDKKTKYENKDGSRYDNRDGRNKGHWGASGVTYVRLRTTRTDVTDTIYVYKGTPGNVNSYNPSKQPHLKDTRTGVPANRIVFNEVANRSDANKAYEWIELRNVAGKGINLKNHLISVVTSNNTDTEIYKFTGDVNVPKDGILLLVDTDPKYNRDHPLQIGAGVQYKVTDFKGNGLPDGGNFVLFLRGRADNKPDGIGTGKPDHVLDIAGYATGVGKNPYSNPVSSTNLWPLKNFEAPASDKNRFDTDTVHYRQHVSGEGGKSGVGTTHGDKKEHQVAFRGVGYTGVGYKRLSKTIAAHGGTPGYPNNAYQGAGDTVKASVYISEIMYADNKAGVLPQWIEIRNTSKSVGANLHNFRLTITNHADMAGDDKWRGKGSGSVLLRNLRIKPNSAVLIASRRAVQRLDVSTVHMPSTDIFILWTQDKKAFRYGIC